MIRPVRFSALLLVLFGLAACDSGTKPKDPELTTVILTSEDGKNSIMLGETLQLTAEGKDQEGNEFPVSSFTWSSNNTAVATVNANGVVTAVASGAAVITAEANGKQGTFNLTVSGSLHSTDVMTDQTWKAADNPHLVTRLIEVAGAASPLLTIEAGAVIRFRAGAGLAIGGFSAGSIKANGTATAGISMVADASNPAKGFWTGLDFSRTAGPSELHFVTMSHCGGTASGTEACIELEANAPGQVPKLLVDNVTIQNSSTYGFKARGGSGFATGSTKLTVTGGDRQPIFITPNEAGGIPTGGTFTTNTPNQVLLRDGTVSTSQTWPNVGIPYVLSQDVSVEGSGAPTLTVAAGTEIRFDALRGLSMGTCGAGGAGNLIAEGTAAAPVKFTANSATPTAGFWGQLYFGCTASAASRLNHVLVEYGGGISPFTVFAGNVMIEQDIGPMVTNTTSRLSKDCGIVRRDPPWTTDFTTSSLNNTFTGNARDQCGPLDP